MQTALFAKMQLEIPNTGIIYDHILDMKMTVLRYHELVLKIDNKIKAIAEVITRDSIEIQLLQYKSK